MSAIFEVFYQPGKLFAGLENRRGAWVLPLILNMLLFAGLTLVTLHFIGLDTILRQRLEATRLTPEQIQTALSRPISTTQTYVSDVASGAAGALGLLAIAGILAIFAMMSDRPPKFRTMFSMVALAFLPYYLILLVMTTLVMIASPDPTSLDVSNLLATNAGAFLNKTTTAKWLYSVAVSMDLLSFGEIAMLSYGFSKITRSSFASGLGAVLSIWILYVFVKAVLSSLF